MTRSGTSSSPHRASALRVAAATFAAVAALACVSGGAHREVVAERDALAKRVTLLERTTESLDSERVQLIAELEEYRVAKEQLDGEVAQLAERKEQLEIDLAKTSKQLAARSQEVDSLRSTYDGLVTDLQGEVAAGRVQIEQLRDGLHVKLAQEVLFDSGSAQLSQEGERVLAKVAGRLAEVNHQIEVQGHTDNVAITGALAGRYPSNWELAAARASVVVRLLVKRGIPASRLQATSFADTQPVAPNGTPQGRARNRRIDIRLVPPTPGERPAPAPAPSA